MCADFKMKFRHSEGNLHVRASGGFDGDSACALLALFMEEYRAGGRIFVDTTGLNEIHPSGRVVLDSGLGRTRVSPASLFFKGEKGFPVAPSGSIGIVMCAEYRRKRRNARNTGAAENVRTAPVMGMKTRAFVRQGMFLPEPGPEHRAETRFRKEHLRSFFCVESVP